jgi:carboxypeptidase Q
MKLFISLLFVQVTLLSFAQKNDSIIIRDFYTEALEKGKAHEDLRSLCKDVGARLSGSPQAEMAVQWAKQKCELYGLDNIGRFSSTTNFGSWRFNPNRRIDESSSN